jgi:hypothetical protein
LKCGTWAPTGEWVLARDTTVYIIFKSKPLGHIYTTEREGVASDTVFMYILKFFSDFEELNTHLS